MRRTGTLASLLLLAAAASQAATVNTTVNVTANIPAITGTTVNVTGTASLTNIGSGTFSATVSLTSLSTTGNATIPFLITLTSGGSGTITGNLAVPLTLLFSPGPGQGTLTVTGGTYGATGGSISVSGNSAAASGGGYTVTFTGTGSVTTGSTSGGGTGTGGGPTTPAPTVTAVQDAASYTAGIAQGSIFVVKGSNMSASGLTQFSFPLPTASTDGVKITLTPTAGGSGTTAYLVYLYNQSGVNQLAAVLPSTLATGNYNLTVTSNTNQTSTPVQVTVVQRKPGLISQDSSGTGLALVQNYVSASELDVDRFTTGAVSGTKISPGHPGQVLIAWGTGLGGVPGGDNVASQGYDFTKNGATVQAIVGGQTIPAQYAGRAPGLAGADQINFQLPSNVPTGCAVSFQISVNGSLSNSTFIAIAPDATSAACVVPGFTTTQLQNFDNGGTYTIGSFSVDQISETVPSVGNLKIDTAGGEFVQFNGFQLATAASYAFNPGGACQVFTFTGNANQTGTPTASPVTSKFLDAGKITLTGPAASSLSAVPLNEDGTTFLYSLSIATEGITIPGQTNLGTIVAGTYSLHGAGGKDVGPFDASVTLGSPLTITGGLPTTVTRSAGLNLSWTGGNSADLVEIFGSSGTSTGGTNPTVTVSEFYCLTTAGTGGINVPSSITTQLPATGSATLGGYGSIGVYTISNFNGSNGSFTAPLTAGGSINAGYFLGLVGIGGQATYQ